MTSRRSLLLGSIAAVATLGGEARARGSLARAGTAPTGRDPDTCLDPRLYLFVDDRWIEEKADLKRILKRAEPLPEPIIAPDDPRTERDCAWGNVIREPDGRFWLWYVTMSMGHRGQGAHEMANAGVWGRGEEFSFKPRSPADVREVDTMLGKVAQSPDGRRWTKPRLGLIEYRGSRKNNIVLNGERAAAQSGGALTNFDGWTVLRLESPAEPSKRYAMLAHWESVHCWDNHEVSGSLRRPKQKMDRYWAARGKYLTFSPDGLRWDQPLERIAFPDGGGDRFLVVRDRRNQRWWGYSRAAGWGGAALSTGEDLRRWSEPQVDRGIVPSATGYPQIECMVPFNYGNQNLGFPVAMDKARGFLPVFLASQHEGEAWRWIESRQPFIPLGPPGSYYATGAVPLHNEPFIEGDRLLIYFNAFAYNQDPPCPHGARSIGLATLRRDGFAGLAPATVGGEGTLLTRPLAVTGKRLFLNLEPSGPGGAAEVALLAPDRSPIPGFGLGESVPVQHDHVRCPVRWKKAADLATLHGKHVRVLIRLRSSAVLHSLAFEE